MKQLKLVSFVSKVSQIFFMLNYLGQNIKQIREYWKITQGEFGWLINASRGMVMQYEKRGSTPKNETFETIVKLTGVSRDILSNVLLEREDLPEMPGWAYRSLEDRDLDDEDVNDTQELMKSKPSINITGIELRRKKALGGNDDDGLIYVPIAAQAGYSRNFLDPVYIGQLERLYVPGLPYKGDNYRYFEVEGDSMYPTLEEGMQVIAQKIEQEDWKNISNYYIYVIVKQSQILIKRLFKHKSGNYTMISDNEALYGQEKLLGQDIKELWLVKRKLDWDMAPPKHYDVRDDEE